MIEFAVLADDLTGGMMIASFLERAGVACPVVTEADAVAEVGDAEAVVLARKIRLVEPETARAEARAAADAFRGAGAARVYSKYCALFDSTDRGNIGPIAEELMAATGAPRTIFCPAFVERRVIVRNGHMFLGETPLSDSFKRHDPVTPMTNSNLVEVLQAQTQEQVGLLDLGALRAGRVAAEACMDRQAPTRFFIADAETEADIAAIAGLVRDWPLVTGGDSLPAALADAWRGESRPAAVSRPPLPAAPGHEAVLAGSCAAPTRDQIDAFGQTHPVWRVDLAADMDPRETMSRIAAWAAPRLAGGPVLIATSADPDGVAAAQARHGREGAANLADGILGGVAQRLFDMGVRKFVVAGGETSGEVLAALGVRRLRVGPYDELCGGYCHQAGPQPVSFVLKAGSMGERNFFFRALERMREAEEIGAHRPGSDS